MGYLKGSNSGKALWLALRMLPRFDFNASFCCIVRALRTRLEGNLGYDSPRVASFVALRRSSNEPPSQMRTLSVFSPSGQ